MVQFKHLDEKTIEIAAISASIAAACQPCLKYHYKKAIETGCTKEEIEEAIELGKMIKMSPENEIQSLAGKLLKDK